MPETVTTLQSILLQLLPGDHTAVGNITLLAQFQAAARQAGQPIPTEDDFKAAKKALVASGKTLVLEIKGEDSPQDQAKRAALALWVQAVTEHGGFGTWAADVVAGSAAGLRGVVGRHA